MQLTLPPVKHNPQACGKVLGHYHATWGVGGCMFYCFVYFYGVLICLNFIGKNGNGNAYTKRPLEQWPTPWALRREKL